MFTQQVLTGKQRAFNIRNSAHKEFANEQKLQTNKEKPRSASIIAEVEGKDTCQMQAAVNKAITVNL